MYYAGALLVQPFWTNPQLEEVIGGRYIDSSPPSLTPSPLQPLLHSLPPPCPGLSAEQLQLFISHLLSALHIEALVMGNVSKDVGNIQQTLYTQQPKV